MNDNNGFIVINRKMLKWEWYQDTNTVRLFLHLLLIANWEDRKWQGINVKRGEIITSRKHLSENTGLSIQQVRTSLNKLISTNEITIKTTNKYTVITVNNYNKYQDYNQQPNNRATNEQQTNNNQITTTKQIKQINNKTNNIYNNTIGETAEDNQQNLIDYVETNFGRTLSPIEVEEILSWKNTELTKYAIKQSVLAGKVSVKYIARILNAYERENIKSVQQAQMREREYIEAKKQKRFIQKTHQKSSTEKMQDVFERFLAKGEE